MSNNYRLYIKKIITYIIILLYYYQYIIDNDYQYRLNVSKNLHKF